MKLQWLGCVGLHRVRLIMWLAKQGWHPRPQAGQSASRSINIDHPCHCPIVSSIITIASLIIIIIDYVIFHSKSLISFFSPMRTSYLLCARTTSYVRCLHDPLWGWPCGGECGNLAAHDSLSICNVIPVCHTLYAC